jgi:hypothetical protein
MGSFEQCVFISYAWEGESEEIVNRIDQSLQKRGLTIIRDKRDLGYKGSIKKFMERIGQGNCIIVVVNDKYLRSSNCMFELVEIAQDEKFFDRIFPIVLSDANIYDPVKRLDYVKYWEAKKAELASAMQSVDPANLQGVREDIDNYNRFRDKISSLTSFLKDMNTLKPEMHQDSDFEILYQAIDKRMRQKGLNVDELISVLEEAFSKDDPRIRQLRRVFTDIQKMQQIQQTLYEWKELHNALDDIITSFAPFSSEIQRADKENVIPSASTLRNLWYAVSMKVDALLEFSSTINYIGKRYKEEGSFSTGENWAVKLSGMRRDINKLLGLDQDSGFNSTTKLSISFTDKGKLRLGIKPDWWVTLFEYNNEFNHLVYGQMHWADKKLRESATELYSLSMSVFGSEK